MSDRIYDIKSDITPMSTPDRATPITFRQWLKDRRKEFDLTQAELAQQAGCSVVTIRRIEEGVLRPSRQLADLILASLEVPPHDRPAYVRWARSLDGAPPSGLRKDAASSHRSDGSYFEETTTSSPKPLSSGSYQGPAEQEIRNPYKGLRAFQEADAPDFFGREALTQRLVSRLDETTELARFLAVVGPSGSGKSSVVRAGLIPTLRHDALSAPAPVVVDLIPGAHPLEELEAGLLRVAVNPPGSLLEQLKSDERGLIRAIKRTLPGDERAELWLIIDQFEEVFTLMPDESARADLLDSLFTAATDPRSRIHIVCTLRADFYDRPLLYTDFGELLRQRTEVVLPLAPDELYKAIIAPAERVGVELEGDLVTAILQDVGEQPGRLPLLQYSLTELFERRRGRLLTLETYFESGGVLGALSRRAEEIYGSLTPLGKGLARQVFLRLVTLGEGIEDTRRRVRLAEMASLTPDKKALDEVLEVFGRYRLLTFDRDPVTQGPTVEVAHEALLQRWERLRGWLDDSRDSLRVERKLMSEASDWIRAGREHGFLATGTRLAQFEALSADEASEDNLATVALNQEEKEYVQASVAERDRQVTEERHRQSRELTLQRQAASRLRYLVIGLGVFLLVALVLGAWALNQSQAAQDNATLAQKNEQASEANLRLSEAQRLAAEAKTLLQAGGSSELIGLLAVKSIRTEYTPEGDGVLVPATYLDYPIQEFAGHTERVAAVAFSPDGKYALTASDDTTLRLWDTQTGAEVRRFTGHAGPIYGIAYSHDGKYALSTSGDGTVRLWDIHTGAEVRRFGNGESVASSVAFSPDSKYALIGSDDATAKIWDVETGKLARTLTGHTAEVLSVTYSSDGKYIATGSNDDTAILWDPNTGQALRTLSNVDTAIAIAFSPDDKLLLIGTLGQTLALWDVQTGQQVRSFSGVTAEVESVAFSPDGKYVLSGGNDKLARLWDVTTGVELRRFIPGSGIVNSVAFSPDGKYALTGSDDKVALLWDLVSHPGLPQFNAQDAKLIYGVAFSPDGLHVFTGNTDRTVRMWDARTGALERTFSASGAVFRVAVSPDGKLLLAACYNKVADLWNVRTGEHLRTFSGPTSLVFAAAFSPDGNYVLLSSDEGKARLLETQTGKELRQFGGNNGVFSPDGKYVLTAQDKIAKLWDANTGNAIRDFEGHSDAVTDIAFSPDGKYVLTASNDTTARLWDVKTGAPLHIFAGHTGALWQAAFSPDGKEIATASEDWTARIWDASSGVELRRLSGHTGAVFAVAFSADGKYVLTGSGDHTAKLWDVDYETEVRSLCSSFVRDFSDAERAQYSIRDQIPTCSKR